MTIKITRKEDRDQSAIATEHIETDFPEGDFKIYVRDNIFLLPNEH